MSVRVQSDLGTSLAQEDAFFLAENSSSFSSMVFAAHKMTNKKETDETSLCGDVRVWPTWESINQVVSHRSPLDRRHPRAAAVCFCLGSR